MMERIKKVPRYCIRVVFSGLAKISYKVYTYFRLQELKISKLYLPIFNSDNACRCDASKDRLQIIKREIASLGLKDKYGILDIGCNNGYFVFDLAREGNVCIGIDAFPEFLDEGRFIIDCQRIKSVGLIEMFVSPDNIEAFPEMDITIFLSVIQKLAKQYGFQESTDILVRLWQKTRIMMFFEMPDSMESVDIFKEYLPEMGSTKDECNKFIETFLIKLLDPKEIKILGEFEMEYRQEKRTMFLLKK